MSYPTTADHSLLHSLRSHINLSYWPRIQTLLLEKKARKMNLAQDADLVKWSLPSLPRAKGPGHQQKQIDPLTLPSKTIPESEKVA